MDRKILPLTVVAFILLSAGQSFADGEDTARADSSHISEGFTHYPSEENTTELEITDIKGGIFGFTIKNIGKASAKNSSWQLYAEGGLVLFGRYRGQEYNSDFEPDEEWIIKLEEDRYGFGNRFIYGFGKVTISITIEADNAERVEKTVETFLFLIFLFEI